MLFNTILLWLFSCVNMCIYCFVGVFPVTIILISHTVSIYYRLNLFAHFDIHDFLSEADVWYLCFSLRCVTPSCPTFRESVDLTNVFKWAKEISIANIWIKIIIMSKWYAIQIVYSPHVVLFCISSWLAFQTSWLLFANLKLSLYPICLHIFHSYYITELL